MNIFLVRHGQTLLNQSNTHQYSTTPLSEKGLEEVRRLAERLKEAEIDVMYSSPMKRAKQTAETIAQLSGNTIVFLDDLREVKRPSEIEGKNHDDTEAEQIKEKIKENIHDELWHYSDEENFFDIKKRVELLKAKMEQEPVENVLLVSHGVVIKMFLALCIFGEALDYKTFYFFLYNVHVSNTGISQCQFSQEKGWKVVRVNDATHLSPQI